MHELNSAMDRKIFGCCFCDGDVPKSEFFKELRWLKPVDWNYHQCDQFNEGRFKVGDRRCIEITCVLTGTTFFIAFSDGKESDEHLAMINRLNEGDPWMPRCYRHTIPARVGHLLAYFGTNGLFSRGIVSSLLPHVVTLFDPDSGIDIQVPYGYLKAISPEDSRVRFKGFRAKLHNFRVLSGRACEAKDLLLFAAQYPLNAEIKSLDPESGVIGVNLFMGKDTNISEELGQSRLYSVKSEEESVEVEEEFVKAKFASAKAKEKFVKAKFDSVKAKGKSVKTKFVYIEEPHF